MSAATPEPSLLTRFPALARLGAPFRRRRRIPYVPQAASADCGAACLAMVLAYHGRHVRLEAVRRSLGVGRDGTDARSLLAAARRHGLRGRGVKVERVEDLAYLPPASILHWRFRHFVVFERLRRGGAELVDPAAGRRRVSRQRLDRELTGVALLFEPADGFATAGKPRSAVWRYLRQVLGARRLIARVAVLSLLIQVLALAVPVFTGVLVDRVVPYGDRHLLAVLSAGLAALVVFRLLSSALRAYALLHLRTQLDSRLTLDFLDHLVDLPYAFFQRRAAGDLMMRLNSNATIREILTAGVLSTLLDGIMVGLYLVLLLLANAAVGLLVLALGALRFVLFLAVRRRHRDLMSESLETQARSQSYAVEMLAGIETLKASGAEHRAVGRWSNLFVDVLNVSLARGRLSALTDAALEALDMASPLAILAYGGWLVLGGQLTLGTMLALSALAMGFLGPLSTLVATAFQLQLLSGYLARIEDVFETLPEQDASAVVAAPRLRGAIALEGLSFRYHPRAPEVVREVSVAIPAGSLVAVVGRSGAGKTTLAALLAGLYPATAGRVLLDGHDLAGLDLRSVRGQLGFVSQHPYLFAATIRDNIALVDPGLPLERIVAAARQAQVHDDVAAMPMGYETVLADGGASLSGGQRQRLALARALVHRPAILILDEATSALDAVTEAAIQRQLAALTATRVVVAHRLSTVRDADLILVMEAGRVVERGRHRALMAAGGVYRDLVAAQLEKGRSPAAPALG